MTSTAPAVDMLTPFIVLDANANGIFPVTAKHFINEDGEIHYWGTGEPTRKAAQKLADHLNSFCKFTSMIPVPHRLDGSTKGYVCVRCGNWRAIYHSTYCGCDTAGTATDDDLMAEIPALLAASTRTMCTRDISRALGGLSLRSTRSLLMKLTRRGIVNHIPANRPGWPATWTLK